VILVRHGRVGVVKEVAVMTASSTDTNSAGAARGVVHVEVNNQPVELPDREVTGLEIKQAAIGQGVDIQLSFALSVKRGDRYAPVGDDDRVRPHDGEKFLAVAPDDNS
jgi:hypothetical protein